MTGALVLKLGGELLESSRDLPGLARTVVGLCPQPLVIVHGGGRDIDAALARAGIAPRQVDGLRITDEPTLDIVVSVLAGLVNTRLVAALCAAGGAAVGLTGADGQLAPVAPAPRHVAADGRLVDLERVGAPIASGPPVIIGDLLARGYLPVVASIGASREGCLFNVNADIMAAHLAGRIGASGLIFAGGTAGVLDDAGRTIPRIAEGDVGALIASRQATAGMAAKLRACLDALHQGVPYVAIVDGRDRAGLSRAAGGCVRGGTVVVPSGRESHARE